MLDVILGILAWVGIILLVLLIIALALVLLVLFFPISYKIYASKQLDKIQVSAKAKWLFGVFRLNYIYPEPGNIVAKLLWMKLFDSSAEPKEENDTKSAKNNKGKNNKGIQTVDDKNKKVNTETIADNAKAPQAELAGENVTDETTLVQTDSVKSNSDSNESDSHKKNFLYTIRNICDKIKEIWENISYYVELLQDEKTRELFSHVCLRLGKILKSIRPKRVEANIVVGTGSPDTTGYLYGLFCMLIPALGSKFIVRPDFEQAILEGELKVSGHVTVIVLAVNGLKLAFDRKLHWFLDKLKRKGHV